MSGSGFTIPVFVLQCPGAAGSVDALTEGGDPTTLCDLGNLLNGEPDADGNWEVTFEGVEVDDCGLVFVAADIDQTEVGGPELLVVENPAEDAVCEVEAAEGYDIEAAVAAAGDEAGDGAGGDGLAETGVETPLLALIAVTVLVAGWYISTQARRLSTRD